MVLNQANKGAHSDYQPKWAKLPLFKSSGSLSGSGHYYEMEFIGFESKTTTCGSIQSAIGPYAKSPDYIPYANFYNPIFTNQAKDALAYIPDPDQGWANPSDCVEFTCTGLYNIAIRLQNPQYRGDTIPIGIPTRTFTIVSNNIESTSVQAMPGCSFQEKWNAWACTTDDIGVMIIDSKDADREDRSSQPIYIQNEDYCRSSKGGEELCYNNRLNAYQDHCWDGFYTCQKREQRFPTVVDQRADGYVVEYTGTPPQEQEFRLYGSTGSPGFRVSIYYPNAGAYAVYNANKQVI